MVLSLRESPPSPTMADSRCLAHNAMDESWNRLESSLLRCLRSMDSLVGNFQICHQQYPDYVSDLAEAQLDLQREICKYESPFPPIAFDVPPQSETKLGLSLTLQPPASDDSSSDLVPSPFLSPKFAKVESNHPPSAISESNFAELVVAIDKWSVALEDFNVASSCISDRTHDAIPPIPSPPINPAMDRFFTLLKVQEIVKFQKLTEAYALGPLLLWSQIAHQFYD